VHIKHLEGQRLRLRDVRPDLPTEFVRIVERAVDPDPAKRYGTAGELEGDLARFVVHDESSSIDRTPSGSSEWSARFRRLSSPRRWRTWHGGEKVAVAAILVLALAGISALAMRAFRSSTPAEATIRDVRSLVVLPLKNASGDASQDYFVDGMTEVLTADLS